MRHYVFSLKCPDCGQYSLTYDFERNGFVCQVYNGFIPCESYPGLWSWVDDTLNALLGQLRSIIGVRIPLDIP